MDHASALRSAPRQVDRLAAKLGIVVAQRQRAQTLRPVLPSEAGLPGAGSYLAWLSAGGASPSTRFTQASVPYRRVDGTTVASDWADLTTCAGSPVVCLLAPINVDEDGGAVSFALVWTGTSVGGAPGPSDCGGWLTIDAVGTTGILGGTGPEWTAGTGACVNFQRLYCFQQ